MSARGLFLLLAAVWAASAAAAESCYTVRPSDGQVTYEVSQAGSAFRGEFRRFGGEICLEGDRVNRVDVWLDPASVHSGLPEIDSALKGDEFFAVDRYPRAEFTSGSVDARGTSYLAHGMLEMKGTRKKLDVPFTLRQDAGNPVAAGVLEIQRLEYAIGTGEWADTRWLGSSVKVSFRARLVPP
jgi:polyisoprenoid-binding protein YceI